MKHNFSRMVVSLLLFIPLYSIAEEKTAATDAAPTQAQMQAMQQQMQTMQTQMNEMMKAKTPEEQKAAMQAHMATMQEHMKSMDQMGCCGQNGMMGEHMQGGSMMMGDCMHQNTTK
jgi:hypothetical protein